MTSWLVGKTATAADANGGTSLAIRSSASDGIVNATSGVTKISSLTGAWTAGDVGHGICASGVFRLISAVTVATTVAAVTTQGSTTLLSANFTAAHVGAAISGTDIPANTVITAVSVGVSATISISATGSHSALTMTLGAIATTTGNVAMVTGTAKAWVVGGMWNTVGGSALATNSPLVNGDTCYLAPAIYRETLTANLTSPTATVTIYGDVSGIQTSSAPGEVRITNAVTTDQSVVATALMNWNAKNFLAWQNISFAQATNNVMFGGTAVHDWTWTDCAFYSASLGNVINLTVTVDIASNYTFRRCHFFGTGGPLSFTFPTSTIADYDGVILIEDCHVVTMGSFLTVGASGANSFKGGGVIVRNCSIFAASNAVATNSANVSTTKPVTIKNCLVMTGSTSLNANTSGQIVEDYNIITGSTSRTNVTTGIHSMAAAQVNIMPMVHFGQERIWGAALRPFMTPMRDSILLEFGDDGNAPALDILNLTSPSCGPRLITSGTATAGSATTLTDTNNHFGSGSILQGMVVKITGGTGSGQFKMIKSHTDTVLTTFGNWITTPDNTSTYTIYAGVITEHFQCTSGSTTTAVQSTASWSTGQWVGASLVVVSGTRAGDTGTVTSNTGTTLTIPALGGALDSTSVIKLYRKTDNATANKPCGCFGRHNTWVAESTTTHDNTTPISCMGEADQAFTIPVHSGHLTTISAFLRYDSTYAGTKPQLQIDANPSIGVTAETKTQVASANTWEQLTLTAFTPTANGSVTVRVISQSTAVMGRAYADTFSVTQT